MFVYNGTLWGDTTIKSKVLSAPSDGDYLFVGAFDGFYRINKDNKPEKIKNPGFNKGVYLIFAYDGKLYAGNPFTDKGACSFPRITGRVRSAFRIRPEPILLQFLSIKKEFS